MTQNVERELKLVPSSAAFLDQLARVDRLGPLSVSGRRHELQTNSFFDTGSHALQTARVGFRRRVVDGQRLATWSIKTDGELLRGVATRSEIELQLDPDTPPATALGALRETARSRGAATLAETVAEALEAGDLPLGAPFLETQTERTILDLESAERGWSVELALDRVQLVGHRYAELEIEAELKRGDEDALEAAREAISSLGEVRESHGSKLSRAMAHLSDCECDSSA
jgi:inorganic triphosphatase YgiF